MSFLAQSLKRECVFFTLRVETCQLFERNYAVFLIVMLDDESGG